MTLRAVLSFVLATSAVAPAARADESAPSAHAEEPAPAKKSLRRKVEPPSEVEVIDLTGDRDPQAFALGAHIGGGYLTNVHSIGQGAGHVALVADFGLGANGSRVWSIEPFVSGRSGRSGSYAGADVDRLLDPDRLLDLDHPDSDRPDRRDRQDRRARHDRGDDDVVELPGAG